MSYVAKLGMLALLPPVVADAVCISEPLEPALHSADTIYVGTVVRSELVPELTLLRGARNSRERRAEISHTMEPEIVFKGDPSTVPAVLSVGQYNDPKSTVRMKIAEIPVLMPGDTLLVVGKSGELTRLGLCTATRHWDAETAKTVYAFFPSSR